MLPGKAIDNTDLRVIEELKLDGRATVRKIGKRLNLPVTTVHNRLRKLVKEGMVKRFTIEPDYEKLGRGVSSFVFASIDHDKLVDSKHGIESLKKQLHSFPEIEKIYAVTGDIDVILFIRVGNVKELDEFLIKKLRSVKGVQKTTTLIVLEED